MGKDNCLPFKVGQVAESMSFQKGYRGAWFRCQIKEIVERKGYPSCALEYYDYPDDKKVRWLKLYQITQYGARRKQLMMRPSYPPRYSEREMPNPHEISEVSVVVDNSWKVGDLVDWWSDGCYWSARVLDILGDDKVKIELTPPPLGEGETYEAFLKDLRPSLEWSPEYGWTVPTSLDGEKPRHCARLIHPVNRAVGELPNLSMQRTDEKIDDVLDEPPNCSSGKMLKRTLTTDVSNVAMDMVDTIKGVGGSACRSRASSGTGSHDEATSNAAAGTSANDTSNAAAGASANNQTHSTDSPKKLKPSGRVSSSSICSDSLEAVIVNLEELANKATWMKRILELGLSLDSAERSPWKFIEHRASSTPK